MILCYVLTPQKPIIHMIPGSGEKKNVFLLEAKFLIFVLCFLISMKPNLSIYFLVIVFHPLPKKCFKKQIFWVGKQHRGEFISSEEWKLAKESRDFQVDQRIDKISPSLSLVLKECSQDTFPISAKTNRKFLVLWFTCPRHLWPQTSDRIYVSEWILINLPQSKKTLSASEQGWHLALH